MPKKTIAQRRKEYREKRDAAAKPAAPTSEPDKAPPVYDLADVVKLGHEIVQLLEKIVKRLEPMRRQTLDELDPMQPPRFVSGGFKRRSGDIYQSVAEPGTPNAGAADADDPSRSVRSTE